MSADPGVRDLVERAQQGDRTAFDRLAELHRTRLRSVIEQRLGAEMRERLMTTGEKKLDTSAVYMVSLDDGQIPRLETILRSFKAKANQEAIFLEIQRNVEIRLL